MYEENGPFVVGGRERRAVDVVYGYLVLMDTSD
jgi:hypothetical protein